ncbi:MAG: dehydrogenase, partial [Candidatus Methylomirabilis sp.]
RNYAPTGNWCVIDNIPSQTGRFRPVAELARNKVPGIEGLYCTGSAWPPYGAAHSMQGYNCYKVMAEDFHLPKPWEGHPF